LRFVDGIDVANSRAQETGDLAVTIPERGGATCPSSEHVAICSKDLFGASFGAKPMEHDGIYGKGMDSRLVE
jgi:hypothetical protein